MTMYSAQFCRLAGYASQQSILEHRLTNQSPVWGSQTDCQYQPWLNFWNWVQRRWAWIQKTFRHILCVLAVPLHCWIVIAILWLSNFWGVGFRIAFSLIQSCCPKGYGEYQSSCVRQLAVLRGIGVPISFGTTTPHTVGLLHVHVVNVILEKQGKVFVQYPTSYFGLWHLSILIGKLECCLLSLEIVVK